MSADKELFVMISHEPNDAMAYYDVIPAADEEAARERWEHMRGSYAVEVELFTMERFSELANELCAVSEDQAEADCAVLEGSR